jgi:hypothetical protein
MTRAPLGILPRGYVFQPIDVGEVADALVGVVARGPEGMVPDLAGPEVLGIRGLARAFLAATGQSHRSIQAAARGALSGTDVSRLPRRAPHQSGTSSWNHHLGRVPGPSLRRLMPTPTWLVEPVSSRVG